MCCQVSKWGPTDYMSSFTGRKSSRIAQRISFSKFTNKQSDPLMVNDSEDEQNSQTDPELKTKLEKIQKKSKSKKMTDEKNVKYEGRVKVHQLLGIPNGGKELTSLTYKKKLEGNVKSWRNLYEEKYVAPPDIVKRISQSSDDESILFKLDFLVLFMSTMVEIQKHGKCKLDFIHYITDDTDLGGIDWCSYIINSMKKCKEGWERCNVNSKFTGALTILTLLYVDKVNCPSENVERKMRPIQFWTMNALRSREECEINNGGFGLGELRELYVDLKGDEIKDKKIFERALCEAYSLYPENKELKEFVEKYKSVYKEIIDVEKDVADTEKDVEKDKEKEGIDTEVKEKESINTEVKEKESETIDTEVKVEEIIDTEKKEKEIIEPTLPNFSFKLSQSTQESEKESKVDEPTEKTKELLKDGKKKASTPENKYVRKNEKSLKTVTEPLRSPYIIRAVDAKKGDNAQERLIWEYLTYGLRDEEEEELEKLEKDEQEEVENNFMNDIFGIGYDLESKKFLLASLNPGVELYGNVIDYWAAVLNYEEKFRNPESLNRLFCYASTIKHMFVSYLKSVKHPKSKEIEAAKLEKVLDEAREWEKKSKLASEGEQVSKKGNEQENKLNE
ncbi:hypothetical protein L1987_69221 [Smallanthus sonchifolius]|uniref:Uncharacterized protein n=1 Tax=Smallanthus sonchifolius TaxID=185202 RepID=A0ACB9B6J1_9ASTR|nr:hypothetical protein L1987_69221 [Smallanthus sonchifolius]